MGVFADTVIMMPEDIKVERTDRNLAVGMALDLGKMKVRSTQSMRIIPKLVSGEDENMEFELPPFTVAGRSRYFTLKRDGYDAGISGQLYRYTSDMAPLQYAAIVPYESWMQNATLVLSSQVEGCCSENEGSSELALQKLNFDKAAFTAQFVFVTPKVEAVKIRDISGQAFVDFKVNQTIILPDFGHNPGELAKIKQSINVVKDNSDTKITKLEITGYASPEGPYSNNMRLAEGRTKALADYVDGLYKFPAGTLTTSWVAEDWGGLRQFLLDNPNFENCKGILAIVDSNLEPDAKDAKIKSDFPAQYKYILENVYPGLRHSDYRVEYVVRSYTSPEEIAEVFRTRPGDLSLQELFVLAGSLPEGSEEYSDVFETAVRLFPDSEEAALNAAVAGMKRGDYQGAIRHLKRAGSSPEAVYARGLAAAYTGNYEEAEKYLKEAQTLGIEAASQALANLEAIRQ